MSHIHYVSFARLWAASFLGLVTLDELRDPKAVFHFECIRAHAIPLKRDIVPVEVVWINSDGNLNSYLSGIDFRGLEHGYVHDHTSGIEDVHRECWREFWLAILVADAYNRVHWYKVLNEEYIRALEGEVLDLQSMLPEFPKYEFVYDKNVLPIGSMVRWTNPETGEPHRLDLSARQVIHACWPTGNNITRKNGESNFLKYRPYGEPPAWRTIW